MRTTRGFTLLEAMIAVAIIGVIAALSVSTVANLGARNAKQNATNEILSLLQSSRTISEQNGSDVYVMVYPSLKLTWNATHTRVAGGSFVDGGSGAIFVYEDVDGDFMVADAGAGDCTGTSGECTWAEFDPTNTSGKVYSATTDRLVKVLDLADYPKKNVILGGTSTEQWPAPFSGATTTSCSFCTDNKGAIVFTDGQALLVKGDGKLAGGVGGLTLRAVDNPLNESRIAVVRGTALITLVKTK